MSLANVTITPIEHTVTVSADGVTVASVGVVGPQGEQGEDGAAGPGLPAGGTADQLAFKVDGTDYNTEWRTPTANPSASIGLTAVNGSASTFMRSDAAPALDVGIAPTWTGQHNFNLNGAASTPPVSITGTWFSGGTSTTTKPQLLIEPSGTTSTGWSTDGTGLGVNAASGFTGNLLDLQVAGASLSYFDSAGRLSVGGGNPASSGAKIVTLGTIYAGGQGAPGFLLNSAGTNYCSLQNDSADTWSLASGTNATSLNTPLLQWTKSGNFSVFLQSASARGLTIKGAASRTAPLAQLQTSAGDSLGNVGGTIFTDYADGASVSTDGTFDDLSSHTTVANTFGLAGDTIRGRVVLELVGHATATRQVRIVFAGSTIFDSGALTCASTTHMVLDYLMIRDNTSTLRTFVKCNAPGMSTAHLEPQHNDIGGITYSGTNILKVTAAATGAGAASGDIKTQTHVIDRGEGA